MSNNPLTRLIKRARCANWRVIQRCAAPEKKDNANKGIPNPIPNQKKIFSLLKNSAAVNDNAKMLTTKGPEHGSAIGPYKRP